MRCQVFEIEIEDEKQISLCIEEVMRLEVEKNEISNQKSLIVILQ